MVERSVHFNNCSCADFKKVDLRKTAMECYRSLRLLVVV